MRAVDCYGEPVLGKRVRAKPCTCSPHPCLTSECEAPHHPKNRSRTTPWCYGQAPDEIDVSGEWCSGCWVKKAGEK